jgi:hypothetical protein
MRAILMWTIIAIFILFEITSAFRNRPQTISLKKSRCFLPTVIAFEGKSRVMTDRHDIYLSSSTIGKGPDEIKSSDTVVVICTFILGAILLFGLNTINAQTPMLNALNTKVDGLTNEVKGIYTKVDGLTTATTATNNEVKGIGSEVSGFRYFVVGIVTLVASGGAIVPILQYRDSTVEKKREEEEKRSKENGRKR